MESKVDYYEVLGVDHDADARTIKRAFLKKARTLPGRQQGARRRGEVQGGQRGLLRPFRRAEARQLRPLRRPQRPRGLWRRRRRRVRHLWRLWHGRHLLVVFGGGASGGRAARTAGRDMGITLRVSLAEAASGCTKTVAYDRLAPCDDCNGSGCAEGGHVTTCSRCHGTGRVVTVQRTILEQMQTRVRVPHLPWHRPHHRPPCETCGGQGRTPNHETVKIDVPAGVHFGQEPTRRGLRRSRRARRHLGQPHRPHGASRAIASNARATTCSVVEDVTALEAMWLHARRRGRARRRARGRVVPPAASPAGASRSRAMACP